MQQIQIAIADKLPQQFLIFEQTASPTAQEQSTAKLAFAKFEKSDFENAGRLFDKCGEMSGWTMDAKIVAAKAYEESGRVDKAITILKSVIAHYNAQKPSENSGPSLAYRYLGDCYKDQSRLDEAGDCYEKSGALAKDIPYMKLIALRCAARVRRRQHRYKEALDLLQKGATSDNTDMWWHFERGVAYYELGQYDNAVADLSFTIDRINKDRNKHPDAYSKLLGQSYSQRASCYEKLGKSSLAAADRRALKQFNQDWANDLFGSDSPPAIR